MTGYVARHELSTVSAERDSLISRGLLRVEEVDARNQAYLRLRKTVHKGEAEAIAFALQVPPTERPLFISVTHHARKCAQREGVPTGDLMDLIVDLGERGILTRGDAKEAVAAWDDRHQQLGRPNGYTIFDETYQRRLGNRP